MCVDDVLHTRKRNHIAFSVRKLEVAKSGEYRGGQGDREEHAQQQIRGHSFLKQL